MCKHVFNNRTIGLSKDTTALSLKLDTVRQFWHGYFASDHVGEKNRCHAMSLRYRMSPGQMKERRFD